MPHIVLSHFQSAEMLTARHDQEPSVITSIDLGMTSMEVPILKEGMQFAEGESLSWDQIAEIDSNKTTCFYVENNVAKAIQGFSESTQRYYSLMPTESAPTMLISGIPMHRVKGTDPYRDTLCKIEAIAPIRGYVLDTATGLGYTAIEAAKTALHVVTIELDPQAQEIARSNPWSRSLFDNPKIRQIIGDSFEEIERFEIESFSCIIHDPPTFKLAGELYSLEFYKRAFRVLKHNGRMFHYIGDPESKTGASTTKGVVNRLRAAGFQRIISKPRAFGVVAYK